MDSTNLYWKPRSSLESEQVLYPSYS